MYRNQAGTSLMGCRLRIMHALYFIPLAVRHFPLLATWMNTPHVAPWWSEGRSWSLQDIMEKYTTYVDGYKIVNGQKKPIHGFIIMYDQTPIGYIQYYNVHDFGREFGSVKDFFPHISDATAALDFYIGDPNFIGKGLGSPILIAFLQHHIWPHFQACFVDPNTANQRAIKTYLKAGFKIINQDEHSTDRKSVV